MELVAKPKPEEKEVPDPRIPKEDLADIKAFLNNIKCADQDSEMEENEPPQKRRRLGLYYNNCKVNISCQ